MSLTDFKVRLTIGELIFIATVIASAVGGYYHFNEKISSLEAQTQKLQEDVCFATNNLMRFQYGEYAVERCD